MKIKLPYCKFRGLFERASKPDEAHREKASKKEVHYLDGLLGRAQLLQSWPVSARGTTASARNTSN